jgi:hypothetical protein
LGEIASLNKNSYAFPFCFNNDQNLVQIKIKKKTAIEWDIHSLRPVKTHKIEKRYGFFIYDDTLLDFKSGNTHQITTKQLTKIAAKGRFDRYRISGDQIYIHFYNKRIDVWRLTASDVSV